jgi:hypothetical protein
VNYFFGIFVEEDSFIICCLLAFKLGMLAVSAGLFLVFPGQKNLLSFSLNREDRPEQTGNYDSGG